MKDAKEGTQPTVLVMISGGLDSAACVHFYQAMSYKVETIFIDYGQRANHQEKQAASQVAKYFKVNHRELRIEGAKTKDVGNIQARNAMLLFCGLAEAKKGTSILALGIHSGTGYPDCSDFFLKSAQQMFDVYFGGRMIAAAPFVGWTKRDVYEYFKKNSIPLSITYSCHQGGAEPCGKCEACRDRKALNVC